MPSRPKYIMPGREELRDLVDRQLSNREIAEIYGCSTGTVGAWVRDHGLKGRRSRGIPVAAPTEAHAERTLHVPEVETYREDGNYQHRCWPFVSQPLHRTLRTIRRSKIRLPLK